MLKSIDNLKGYRINAIDGDIGHVDTLLFDDKHWIVRYIVVDTGPFILGRKVLLSPVSITVLDEKIISVDLTKDQIKNSPDINTDKPVSRQHEMSIHKYYGWPYYWDSTAAFIPPPPIASLPPGTDQKFDLQHEEGDPHLRSSKEVLGYGIHAIDGQIGHVDDFIVNTNTWWIPYMIIDTKNILPGKKVLIGSHWIADIRWSDASLYVNIEKETIQSAPDFSPTQPVKRSYEEILYDFYGAPRYWEE